MNLSNSDAAVKLCVPSKKYQIVLEIDFRNILAWLEGLPDILKGRGSSLNMCSH
jgi:hypothetical protein